MNVVHSTLEKLADHSMLG